MIDGRQLPRADILALTTLGQDVGAIAISVDKPNVKNGDFVHLHHAAISGSPVM